MTIKEAANKFEIPKSRLYRGIQKGFLKAKRNGKKWEVSPLAVKAALRPFSVVERDEREVKVKTIHCLLTSDRYTQKFATTSGANEFVVLQEKSGARIL